MILYRARDNSYAGCEQNFKTRTPPMECEPYHCNSVKVNPYVQGLFSNFIYRPKMTGRSWLKDLSKSRGLTLFGGHEPRANDFKLDAKFNNSASFCARGQFYRNHGYT